MPGEAAGELLELVDEDGRRYTDEFFVRGHVAGAHATMVVAWWFASEYCDPAPELGPWRHRYARWSMESTPDGPGLVLRIYDEPGRGRFAVTWAEPVSEIRRREKRAEQRERLRQACLDRWPGAEIVRAGTTSVSFRVPGMEARSVMWSPGDPEQVWVAPIDRPTWEDFVASLEAGE